MINDTLDFILDLSRFDAHTRAEINSEMIKLEKELKKKLQEPLTEWGRARVEKLLAECEQVISGYYDNATKTLGIATDGVVGVAVKSTVAAMVSSVPVSVDIGLPTANMLKSIMGDAIVLGNPVSDWMGKQSQDTVFKFKAEIRQGILQGETNQEIIKRVLPVLDTSRRNVAAVVQTAVHSVASEARQATYDQNYDICGGWVYVSTMDSHSCLICQSYSGARWDADKKPLSGKSWVTVPRHVNCRCGVIMETKTFSELGSELPEPKFGTRASDQGQVSMDLTFDDFLKGKSDAYVDEMLGKGRAKLFKDGKITLSDLTNGNGKPLTLKQLQDKYK